MIFKIKNNEFRNCFGLLTGGFDKTTRYYIEFNYDRMYIYVIHDKFAIKAGCEIEHTFNRNVKYRLEYKPFNDFLTLIKKTNILVETYSKAIAITVSYIHGNEIEFNINKTDYTLTSGPIKLYELNKTDEFIFELYHDILYTVDNYFVTLNNHQLNEFKEALNIFKKNKRVEVYINKDHKNILYITAINNVIYILKPVKINSFGLLPKKPMAFVSKKILYDMINRIVNIYPLSCYVSTNTDKNAIIFSFNLCTITVNDIVYNKILE